MLKSFINHLSESTKKMDCEFSKNNKTATVKIHNNSNVSSFTISFNNDRQMLSLRKDNYLIDEIKVYNDTTSGDQSLKTAVDNFIVLINEKNDETIL